MSRWGRNENPSQRPPSPRPSPPEGGEGERGGGRVSSTGTYLAILESWFHELKRRLVLSIRIVFIAGFGCQAGRQVISRIETPEGDENGSGGDDDGEGLAMP